MLGTPNFGSFAPLQAIRGQYSIVNKLAFLDVFPSPRSAGLLGLRPWAANL
jgi:hypothetical protein